jgi:hypothetical protein
MFILKTTCSSMMLLFTSEENISYNICRYINVLTLLDFTYQHEIEIILHCYVLLHLRQKFCL